MVYISASQPITAIRSTPANDPTSRLSLSVWHPTTQSPNLRDCVRACMAMWGSVAGLSHCIVRNWLLLRYTSSPAALEATPLGIQDILYDVVGHSSERMGQMTPLPNPSKTLRGR